MKKYIILLFAVLISVTAMAQIKLDDTYEIKGEDLDKAVRPMLGSWTALLCNENGAAATIEVKIQENNVIEPTVIVTLGKLKIGKNSFLETPAGTYTAKGVHNTKGNGVQFRMLMCF